MVTISPLLTMNQRRRKMAQAGHLHQVRARNPGTGASPRRRGGQRPRCPAPTLPGRPLRPRPGGRAKPAAPRAWRRGGEPRHPHGAPAPFFPLLHIRPNNWALRGDPQIRPGVCGGSPRYSQAASTRALQPPREPGETGNPDPLFSPADLRGHQRPGPQAPGAARRV